MSWEQFLAIETGLTVNRSDASARQPREGTVLCKRNKFCVACGRATQVRYQDQYPRA
jgi:hypothetical protein